MRKMPGIQQVLNISVLIAFFAVSPAVGAESRPQVLDPAAPYLATKSDPVTHTVDFSIVVTPPYKCKLLKVWMPIPQSDAVQQVTESRFETYPMAAEPQINSEPVYGNRFAYFKFHNPLGAQVIRHRFHATVWNLNWNLDRKSIASRTDWPDSFQPFLQRRKLADETQFRAVLNQIVPQQRGIGSDMASIMQWIDCNLIYDHSKASLQADADHALTTLRGHCSDFHGLCATMGRALGYPTRVTYGLALFPKNSPSHCKLEVYLPPHGWVSFDLSETQKFIATICANDSLGEDEKSAFAAAARARLQSGFRENSWLLMTKGTDYELAPKAAKPVRVVRTAYIEADGKPLPDPDPADIKKREFAWMTVHHFQADRPYKLPFRETSTLVTGQRTTGGDAAVASSQTTSQ